MKPSFKYTSLAVINAVLLTSCSRHDLKTGMEYKHSGDEPPFSATVYVFRQETMFSDKKVSVYKEVGQGEDICIRKKNGEIITSATGTSGLWNNLRGVGAPMGSTLSRGPQDDNPLEVLFGPGDRMPVLESAPCKIEGTSVYVDWSQGHSQYFELAHCNSGSEVFTIRNEGLVLESATRPGFNLTMGGRALTPMEQQDRDERRKYLQQEKELRKAINGN